MFYVLQTALAFIALAIVLGVLVGTMGDWPQAVKLLIAIPLVLWAILGLWGADHARQR